MALNVVVISSLQDWPISYIFGAIILSDLFFSLNIVPVLRLAEKYGRQAHQGAQEVMQGLNVIFKINAMNFDFILLLKISHAAKDIRPPLTPTNLQSAESMRSMHHTYNSVSCIAT